MTEHPVDHDEGVRFEKTDVTPGAVARFGIVLALATTAVAFLLVSFLGALADREARKDPPLAPLAQQDPDRKPPEPRLQEQPFADIEALRAEEHAILTTPGWVDQKAGIARIPVEEAMEILAARGLPTRSATPAPPPSREEAKP